MHLKKLELSGFKSFAKTTVLEFPSRITAIVGPNGSGKSNITEAIRWVLGEQSMKSLRGKKGEDLIWNGSPTTTAGRPRVPRMGKALVTLFFDNSDGKIPLEFEEIVLSRKIFRDGLNEYYINDAEVRLKDVVELIAHVGLGETKHNIISQGEVDRILLSSPRDRKDMFEEALGLRVYQIKKRETERKLDATCVNMKQVEALVREIAPHLKFLKVQAEKSKTRITIENELRQFELFYFVAERKEIWEEQKKLFQKSGPLRELSDTIKKDIAKLFAERAEEEKKTARSEAENFAERKIAELSEKRRELERELGRFEGKLEAERKSHNAVPVADVRSHVPSQEFVRELVNAVREFLSDTRSLLEDEDRIDVVQSHLGVLMEDLERLIEKFEQDTSSLLRGKSKEKEILPDETERMMSALQDESQKIARELDLIQQSQKEARERARLMQERIREIDAVVRAKQDEERDVALSRERFRFDEERILLREKIFGEELALAKLTLADLTETVFGGYEHYSSAELKKRAERLRIKLEEVGGIDPSVIREYEDTCMRQEFLGKELEDLKQASLSLSVLIKELDQHIERDFREGFAKIKNEFHNYFRVIFDGGKASLDLVSEKMGDKEANVSTETSVETGIEIFVDLPRKRIHGLAMLSGGERALTAIALLFAITAVNPPPFLILDETDSALDEANSQRYSAILKELSQKTQLLLVTHNRETMKCAGILYGVTMGEEGVSQFLSLKFEEAEAYTNR